MVTTKSPDAFAALAGATKSPEGSTVFPTQASLDAFYKSIVTDVVDRFAAAMIEEDKSSDPSVVTDVEPKPSTPSDQYYGPAIDQAVNILHGLGYVYKMTSYGLAWTQDGNGEEALAVPPTSH